MSLQSAGCHGHAEELRHTNNFEPPALLRRHPFVVDEGFVVYQIWLVQLSRLLAYRVQEHND